MAGQPGEHQAQAVEQLGAGTEGAADAGDAGPLMESQSRGDIEHLVHLGFGCLGHAPSRIGGQGLQIAPGPLGIEDAQGQRGFPGTGYSGDGDDLVQGNIHVDIFQVVDPRPTDFYLFWHCCLLPEFMLEPHLSEYTHLTAQNTDSIPRSNVPPQGHIANLTNG